jgi:hypothetical protein
VTLVLLWMLTCWMLVIWVLILVTLVTFTGGGGGAAGFTTTAGASLAAWIASADLTGTAAGWGTTEVPLLTDTVAEMVEGTTSVTVLPSVTTVVGVSVVVAAAAEVRGVLTVFDSAGSDGPAKLGLLDGVGWVGPTALVLTAALVGVVAGGAGVEVVGVALGAGVVAGLWVVGGWVVLGASVVGDTVPVGVSMRGAWVVTVALVVGATVGVRAGTVGVGVCTGVGARLSPWPGAGATVVVGSSGAACDTWAVRRALGARAANTATVTMIFFTHVTSVRSPVALPTISKRKRRCGVHHRLARQELISFLRNDSGFQAVRGNFHMSHI